jgi:hypothetical protein
MKKREFKMTQGLTIFTRAVVCLMAIGVLSVCGILLPEIAREEAVGKVNHPSPAPFLIVAWVLSIPIFVALYQTFRLLGYIDSNKAFSYLAVKSLQIIKICAVIFSVLLVLGAVIVIVIAKSVDPTEDVTPVVSIGFVLTFVSSVIATFAAVLQRLLKDAIDIKSENDMTV